MADEDLARKIEKALKEVEPAGERPITFMIGTRGSCERLPLSNNKEASSSLTSSSQVEGRSANNWKKSSSARSSPTSTVRREKGGDKITKRRSLQEVCGDLQQLKQPPQNSLFRSEESNSPNNKRRTPPSSSKEHTNNSNNNLSSSRQTGREKERLEQPPQQRMRRRSSDPTSKGNKSLTRAASAGALKKKEKEKAVRKDGSRTERERKSREKDAQRQEHRKMRRSKSSRSVQKERKKDTKKNLSGVASMEDSRLEMDLPYITSSSLSAASLLSTATSSNIMRREFMSLQLRREDVDRVLFSPPSPRASAGYSVSSSSTPFDPASFSSSSSSSSSSGSSSAASSASSASSNVVIASGGGVDPTNLPALHQSARKGDIDTLRYIFHSERDRRLQEMEKEAIQEDGERWGFAEREFRREEVERVLANLRDEGAATPLHHAVFADRYECTKFLLSKGAEVNTRDEAEATPLHHAAVGGSYRCLKLLLRAGADPQARDKHGTTPLHKAALAGEAKSLAYLLYKGAPATAVDNDGLSALHYAAGQGHVEVLKVLVRSLEQAASTTAAAATTGGGSGGAGERGSTVMTSNNVGRNEKTGGGGAGMEPLVLQRGVLVDKDGHTPLHRAVMADQSNCVEYLLQELKISADDADTSGITALHMAAEKGFLSCAKLLLESGGCKVDPIDKEGRTPLHLACLHGHPEVVRCLLACRANVAIKDASGCTGVHHAAGRGQKQCLELLLQHGAHADIEEDFTTSPLHYAAFKGRTECIDLLLSKGANPNSRDEEGATPLHKAAFRGYLSSVECLLEKGAADHQLRDQDGAYPLHKAAYSNRTSCLKALLAAGAAVNCEDLDQGTPLHNASYKGHLESVKVLIDSGADVQRRDARGRAPLHLAIRHSHLDCAKALIAAGAQIDVQDADGVSPLHFAATGNIEAVDLLVGAGANVDIRNSQERTPLYYSVKSGNFACIRALVKAGADINATDALGKRVAEAGTVITPEVLAKIAAERDETADKQSKEEMGIAVHKFNAKPLGGINWLVEKGKLKNTPEDIAAFLHNTDGLSKTKIGEFIGSNNELSNAVLVAYVEYIDFTDLEFDQALRKFLIKFRLPGEAQIIDRLMEQYAMRFTACNPAVFQYQDSCYMLAFATIMLNTDAHNPSIKNKMTAEGFVSSIRQLNLQEDISTEWLEDLYRRIVTEEIKMESEGILFGSAEKKGWLVKQGGRIKTWKKRWFILSHNCLYYFKAQEDQDPCGMIPLENLAVRRLPKAARKFCFEIYDPDIAEIEKKKKKGVNGNSGSSSGNSGVDDISLTIKSVKKTKEGTGFTQGHHKEYLLCALSNEECDEWINALERNILGTPMNKLLFSRSRSRGAGGRATSLVNWKETYDFAEKCALAQDDEAFLQRFKLEHTIRTETPHPTAKYHLLTDHLNKKHTLIVYSQKWKDPKKLEKTFQACARLKGHECFDPYERYQLKEAAENVFKAANTYIKTGYLLFITGHSLGAAVSLLVAALFQQSKLVHPTRVVLFGCPRMIRREDLSEWPATLPVLRIDDAKDPVISLFPNFLAVGPELILLKEKFFCYMRHPEDRELPVNVLDRDWMQEQIPFHGIEFYLSRLKCKFQGPVHVNEWDKQRFVG